jgi:hypothetical protein
MVRHAPPLLRLAPVVLLLAACGHAAPRPTLAQREAQCAPAWSAAHVDIDTKGAACTADWECREVRPEYLGCDAWANTGFRLSEARILELENACAPISFVPDCGVRVGACVAGRCTGRSRVIDAASCTRSKAALDTRLAAPTTCASSSDCDVVMVRGLRGAGPADWAGRYASEVAAIREACTPDGDGLVPATLPVATCVASRCQLQPGDEVSRPPRPPVIKPRFADKGCVGHSLGVPRDLLGAEGSVTVKFMVSTRGVPYAFEFFGTRRRELMNSLAEAISRCALIPAQQGGLPIEVGMLLPIRFAGQ